LVQACEYVNCQQQKTEQQQDLLKLIRRLRCTAAFDWSHTQLPWRLAGVSVLDSSSAVGQSQQLGKSLGDLHRASTRVTSAIGAGLVLYFRLLTKSAIALACASWTPEIPLLWGAFEAASPFVMCTAICSAVNDVPLRAGAFIAGFHCWLSFSIRAVAHGALRFVGRSSIFGAPGKRWHSPSMQQRIPPMIIDLRFIALLLA
jgi:hypothetical protein